LQISTNATHHLVKMMVGALISSMLTTVLALMPSPERIARLVRLHV